MQIYFTSQEAALYLRLSDETLSCWRWKGVGPAFIKRVHPGGRKPIIRYTRAALDEWLCNKSEETPSNTIRAVSPQK